MAECRAVHVAGAVERRAMEAQRGLTAALAVTPFNGVERGNV
jgi:hypothetical protein